MPTIPRRVVTGHDGRGVSVFADDGPVPVVRTAPDGAYFYEIWGTDAAPAPIGAAEPDQTSVLGFEMGDLAGELGIASVLAIDLTRLRRDLA